ncbi:hypothetical protein [Palleronia sp. LCG004]|uniref:hypothetical protein n=1 Tax=Palleronia sp. LCG004 TaxID=3079304 RepID=UPI002942FE9F|nr:hypothetical protein [Palleronia sp. LCG004]WOI57501.1 hypothetical protein RVY76_06890 [Palleronia sp. LCG004]
MRKRNGDAARVDVAEYLDGDTRPEIGLARAFRTLLSMPRPGILDLDDRRIEITGPLDLFSLAGRDVSRAKHLVRNGTIVAVPGGRWTETTHVRSARHDPSRDPAWLFDLGPDAVDVGSSVGGQGEGVFVRSIDPVARSVELSQPLRVPPSRRPHTFGRARYAIDLSGLRRVAGLTLERITLELRGAASGVLLAPEGEAVSLLDCTISAPHRYGVASPGRGCQGLRVERCRFDSLTEIAPARRRTAAIACHGDGALIRDSGFTGFGTALILAGTGQLVLGNEFAQSPRRTSALPTPAVILSRGHAVAQVRTNRFANCTILLSDRHCDERVSAVGLGGVAIGGNIFEAWAATDTTAFLVVKPCGPDRAIRDVAVDGNTFRSLGGPMRRVERVDESTGTIDRAAAASLRVMGNIFCGITNETRTPVTLRFDQPEAARRWILEPAGDLAFGGCLGEIVAILPEWPLLDHSGQPVGGVMPQVRTTTVGQARRIELHWPEPVSGRVAVTLSCDRT